MLNDTIEQLMQIVLYTVSSVMRPWYLPPVYSVYRKYKPIFIKIMSRL